MEEAVKEVGLAHVAEFNPDGRGHVGLGQSQEHQGNGSGQED